MVSAEQVAELRSVAEFDRARIGVPGCMVRQRATWMLEMLRQHEALVDVVEHAEVLLLELERLGWEGEVTIRHARDALRCALRRINPTAPGQEGTAARESLRQPAAL